MNRDARRRPDDRRLTVPIKMPPELVVALDTECDRLICSRSKLVELALERWLNDPEISPTR